MVLKTKPKGKEDHYNIIELWLGNRALVQQAQGPGSHPQDHREQMIVISI